MDPSTHPRGSSPRLQAEEPSSEEPGVEPRVAVGLQEISSGCNKHDWWCRATVGAAGRWGCPSPSLHLSKACSGLTSLSPPTPTLPFLLQGLPMSPSIPVYSAPFPRHMPHVVSRTIRGSWIHTSQLPNQTLTEMLLGRDFANIIKFQVSGSGDYSGEPDPSHETLESGTGGRGRDSKQRNQCSVAGGKKGWRWGGGHGICKERDDLQELGTNPGHRRQGKGHLSPPSTRKSFLPKTNERESRLCPAEPADKTSAWRHLDFSLVLH